MLKAPMSNRLHIGIFGKTNTGKSSLINAITGQDVSIVSSISGTTTDSVYKAMEIKDIGAVTFIDTAGFDDTSELADKRMEKTNLALEKTDIGIVVFTDEHIELETAWIEKLTKLKTPFICVINKIDVLNNVDIIEKTIKDKFNITPLKCSATDYNIDELRLEILKNIPDEFENHSILGDLVHAGDTVLLVMPQDIGAPKGRLILPQVQTTRELLDKGCIIISTVLGELDNALNALKTPPKLIITDSQVFKEVYPKVPKESKLTSFSILFAAYKGDIDYFVKSVNMIEKLTENSKVLIAEACTHAPQTEDIGRVKIPNMLRKKVGAGLTIDITSGANFPGNVTEYDLIIHCGACMFNKKHTMSRIDKIKQFNIPMTNYGITIAYLTGILDKVSLK